MKIIIVGCGKVGYTIAKNLSVEKNVDIIIIDNRQEALDKTLESIDAMFIRGSGLNVKTLQEAGAKDADLLISVAGSDEINILCCISAKRLGTAHTIARIRDPEFASELNKLWKELGLDMIINPEQQTAREISRLLRFPSADDIGTFIDGRVELVSFKASETNNFFTGKTVEEIFNKKKTNILLAVIERDNNSIIPNGSFVFENDDIIKIIGRPSDIMEFFTLIGKNNFKIKNALIIGGGKITHYLTTLLQRHIGGTNIKIIEKDKNRCEELNEQFPRCLIINGDGTDENILMSEMTERSGAVVCLTDRDEENTIIALYSLHFKINKVILKINHINQHMVKNLGLGSIISPKNITSRQIIHYVRSIANTSGSEIKAVNKIFENGDDRVEAIEFNINEESKCLNVPIKGLKIKKGILIGCIVRNNNIIIPSGDTLLKTGDRIVVIIKDIKIVELDDILAV